MTAEEIRNLVASPWTALSQSLMLREIAAQFAEQNELMRADQEFRRAVANERREERKKLKRGMFSWPHRAPRLKGCANHTKPRRNLFQFSRAQPSRAKSRSILAVSS